MLKSFCFNYFFESVANQQDNAEKCVNKKTPDIYMPK